MDKIIKRYKDKSLNNFNRIAAGYDQSWDGKWSALMYEEVLQKIDEQPFKTMLDVGCGTGSLLAMVVKQYDNVQVSGIDFSPKMLNVASQVLGNQAELVLGDAEKLPWPDNSFDLLVCNSSFHHYPEPLKVLMEMRRVLKSNGRVIIADPWWSGTIRLLINLYLRTPLNMEGDVRIYSQHEFKWLLSKCGFKSIEWEKPSNKYCIARAVNAK